MHPYVFTEKFHLIIQMESILFVYSMNSYFFSLKSFLGYTDLKK